MNVEFAPIQTEQELQDLATMAHEIWNEYWPALIGQAQTDYMVSKFQSLDAIKAGIAEEAYEYWFVCKDGKRVGYTGGHIEPETNRFFVSKIYLLAEERGKGYSHPIIAFYEDLCRDRGLRAMYLTVNKYNEMGTRAYEARGFVTIDSVETDIGEGFIMDDFIMEKEV